jgi:hypothetical protein
MIVVCTIKAKLFTNSEYSEASLKIQRIGQANGRLKPEGWTRGYLASLVHVANIVPKFKLVHVVSMSYDTKVMHYALFTSGKYANKD